MPLAVPEVPFVVMFAIINKKEICNKRQTDKQLGPCSRVLHNTEADMSDTARNGTGHRGNWLRNDIGERGLVTSLPRLRGKPAAKV